LLLQEVRRRYRTLRSEYQSGGWYAHHRELSQFLMPRTGRYFMADSEKTRRNEGLIDNTATRAARVLAAGLMSGMSSPHQPWVRLQTSDPELNMSHPVRTWLDDVTQRMMRVMARSNFYRTIHQMYEELAVYGTAACVIVGDFERVVHCHALTAGQYYISATYQGKVVTLYREFRMTVSQIVREFGKNQCSLRVQSLHNEGSLDEWIECVHAIEPRYDRNVQHESATDKPWRSIYFEIGDGKNDIDSVLRESGFDDFPALAPRWGVVPGDIYGNGPGMEALSDVIQLQDEQFRKGQAIAYAVKPPLQLPTDMKNREVDFDPGGENYTDPTSPQGGIRPAWETRLDLGPLLEDIQDVRTRINGSFFADLFLMLHNTVGPPQRTATEVAELHSEKLLMLGPVLERLDTELLSPAVDQVFKHMVVAGLIPPAPVEMQGMMLQPEFVSVLAQAQKAAGINSIDRYMGGIGAAAQVWPEVTDKIDADAWADEMAVRYNVPPKILREDDDIADLRQSRAKAMAAQESQDAEAVAASTAVDVAKAQSTAPAQPPVDPVAMAGGFQSPV